MQRFHPSAFAPPARRLPLGGCSSGQLSSTSTPAAASSSIASVVGVIDGVVGKFEGDVVTGNLALSADRYGEAHAEITPQGDLLIVGQPVPLSPAQRCEVLAYRQQVVEIAQRGMEIGKQGVTLGMRVASQALAGGFAGQSKQQIRQHAEDQAVGTRKAAAQTCDHRQVVMTSQQTLVADVPAFKPYATMSEKDVSACRQDVSSGNRGALQK